MRKLATVREISNISSIEGANAIEVAQVDGWKVVVKKNEFKLGDLVVYLEIDSWVPTTLAPFLSKGKEPKVYNQVQGERLRTVKLRGQVSQGLIIPLISADVSIGDDLTDSLGIQKWEMPINPKLQGLVKGNFPSCVPKTDQERVQNIKLKNNTGTYEITEKLEGSSMTCFLDNDSNFEVCSRNLSLKESEDNAFWQAARQYSIKEKMLELNLQGYAIQGELIGGKIQGNIYCLNNFRYYVYDIYNTNTGEYLTSQERINVVLDLNLLHVPVLGTVVITDETSVDEILNSAEGTSLLYNTEREGVVYKNIEDGSKTFKAISNKYLLKEQ